MSHPRRSLLFMPGSNPRALKKARELPADGFILDLEDAVAPEAKENARTIVAAALAEGGYGARELVLRVNTLETAWGHADLAAAATMPIDAGLLPKVDSPDRVRLTVSLLDGLGAPKALRARRRDLGFDKGPPRGFDSRSPAAVGLARPRDPRRPRARAGGARRRPPRPPGR